MAIDKCRYTFKELASNVLPSLMKQMNDAIKMPMSMREFTISGVGRQTILKQLGKKTDFQGCYVLIDDNGPSYVGISRGVVQRIIQQVKGKTHFDASFAYRRAAYNYEHAMSRGKAMKDDDFKQYFAEAKKYIASMSVAFIEIMNELELYLFEVYCSMELNTSQWNTFKTH